MTNKNKREQNIPPNIKRRLMIHSSWALPMTAVVTLPAHAQATLEPPLPPPPLEPLLYISSVLSNPMGGDCGPSARETVSITNGGTGEADLSNVAIQRALFFFNQTIATLSGTLAAGATETIDVCDGIIEGDSAVLNNGNGGVIILSDSNGTIDNVSYPPAPNSAGQGIIFNYPATPSTSDSRSPE